MTDGFKKFKSLGALGDTIPLVGLMREIIERITLFEDFEPHELEQLARYMTCCRTDEGTEIIREGEIGDYMLLILVGSVEIVKLDARGLPARIAVAGPGKTLGEMSLIDGEPRFASCVALTEVQFAVLDRAAFSRLIAEEARVGVKLMVELLMLVNQRLRNVTAQLMECRESKRIRIR